jgi:hypothetical protein
VYKRDVRSTLRPFLVALAAVLLATAPAQSGFLDRLFGKGTPSDEKVAAGLKEALEIGIGNAVAATGRLDGFFKNEAIKILMPEKLKKFDKGLRAVGLGSSIDAFVLSMNRAAERAAPSAKSIFKEALAQMTFSDAKQILRGGDTAATTYFREKTSDRLAAAFRPIVTGALHEVGATKRYQDLVGRYDSLPFVSSPSLDLNRYVTDRSLDGLFHVLGEEEMKIRKDPAARVTKLLKEVFTSSGSER